MANDTSAYPAGTRYSEADWSILAGFWHPVAFSTEIAAAPTKARLLDVDLVLWRTAGGLHAAVDFCPHRGTRMSLGMMRGEELVCRYHGLHFAGDGSCTRVPGAPGSKPPSQLKLRIFPVKERYGLVWVCLAGTAHQPIPDCPQLLDPALQQIAMSGVWGAAAGRHTENFNDLAHFAYTHVGTFGQADRPEVAPYTVEQLPHGLRFDVTVPMLDENVFTGTPVYSEVPCEYEVTMPFASRLSMHYSKGWEHIFDFASPVSAERSRIFILKARDHDRDQPVEEWLRFQEAVNEEDREMVESQRPHHLPLDLGEEWHLLSDKFSIAYRRRWLALGMENQQV